MKVVFLKSRAGFRGGLEKYTRKLMQAFVEKGCEVTLLTTGHMPHVPHVNVISLEKSHKFSFFHVLRFNVLCKRWLRKHPCDIVFGMERTCHQTHYRAGSGVHIVYLNRRQMVDSCFKRLSLKINPLQLAILALEKKAFEDPNLKILFTNSDMVRQEILQHYQTAPGKIQVVHNGVEWEQWSSAFAESLTKLHKKPFEFLFVGNGYKRKGLLFLLKGLHQIADESFHLTVIGHDKNPAFFQREAKRLGIQNKISFLGSQVDLLPFYSRADVLVIPSIYDPFANVTLEALAMGLYVVSSQYNGAKEVLTPESGTLIEDLSSAKSVALSLKQALSHPKTFESAPKIRNSIKHLDFSSQLAKIVSQTLQIN